MNSLKLGSCSDVLWKLLLNGFPSTTTRQLLQFFMSFVANFFDVSNKTKNDSPEKKWKNGVLYQWSKTAIFQ